MELNLFALFLIIIAFNIFLNIYIKFSFKYNLVSIPKKRDSHKTITPKGGGIVIYFVLVLFLLFKIYNNNIDDFDIAILISTPIITILSFLKSSFCISEDPLNKGKLAKFLDKKSKDLPQLKIISSK